MRINPGTGDQYFFTLKQDLVQIRDPEVTYSPCKYNERILSYIVVACNVRWRRRRDQKKTIVA